GHLPSWPHDPLDRRSHRAARCASRNILDGARRAARDGALQRSAKLCAAGDRDPMTSVPQIAPDRAAPEPAERLPLPRRPRRRLRMPLARRVGAFAELVRARLAEACALESPPPERFGFRFDTAVRLFMI